MAVVMRKIQTLPQRAKVVKLQALKMGPNFWACLNLRLVLTMAL
jgi:hypothetical protein